MKGFRLDTNIPSELIRTRPEPRVEKWVFAQDEQSLHLSDGLKTTWCPDFKDASCRLPNPSPTVGESWTVNAN
jgi:hypothetical protein